MQSNELSRAVLQGDCKYESGVRVAYKQLGLALALLLHHLRLRVVLRDERCHFGRGADGDRDHVRRLGHLQELVHDRQLVNLLQVVLQRDGSPSKLLRRVAHQGHRIRRQLAVFVRLHGRVQPTLEVRRIALAVVLTTSGHAVHLSDVALALQQPVVELLRALRVEDHDLVATLDRAIVHDTAERLNHQLLDHTLQLSDASAVGHGSVEHERLRRGLDAQFERLARIQLRFHAGMEHRQFGVDDAEQVFARVLLEHHYGVQAVAELLLVELLHRLGDDALDLLGSRLVLAADEADAAFLQPFHLVHAQVHGQDEDGVAEVDLLAVAEDGEAVVEHAHPELVEVVVSLLELVDDDDVDVTLRVQAHTTQVVVADARARVGVFRLELRLLLGRQTADVGGRRALEVEHLVLLDVVRALEHGHGVGVTVDELGDHLAGVGLAGARRSDGDADRDGLLPVADLRLRALEDHLSHGVGVRLTDDATAEELDEGFGARTDFVSVEQNHLRLVFLGSRHNRLLFAGLIRLLKVSERRASPRPFWPM